MCPGVNWKIEAIFKIDGLIITNIMPACNKNHKLCSSQLLFFISKMILYNAEDLDSRYSMCGLRADNMAIGCVLVRTADESAYYSDSL